MKRIKYIVFIFAGLIATGVMATAPKKTPVFTSPSKSIIVKLKSPQVTLTLQSNPTTGFSWYLAKYDRHLIMPVKHQYVAPNAKLVGAPGYEVWTFAVQKTAFVVPQTTHIIMQYARPWTRKGASQAVFSITISRDKNTKFF